MRKLFILLLMLGFAPSLFAQNDYIVTQYIHNRYAINQAFAGARDGLSLFGSYRKQWSGIAGTPTSQLFTAHSPLRNENMALGVSAYNQKFMVAGNSGFSFTYAYRIHTTDASWLSFALSPGLSFKSADWSDVSTIEPGDESFGSAEKSKSPTLGFGVAWYGQQFFAGVSTPSLFYADEFEGADTKFSPADATYAITAGYLWKINGSLGVQPSFLVRYNNVQGAVTDVNATIIYDHRFMLGFSYRSTQEVAATASFQLDRRLRVAYSYDYSMGDLKTYNRGTHEISLQYDFVYRRESVNPKFF